MSDPEKKTRKKAGAAKKTARKKASKAPASLGDEAPEAEAAEAPVGKKAASKKAASKKTASKKAASKKTASKKAASRRGGDFAADAPEYEADESDEVVVDTGSGRGKSLVIVESPAKAKTINKFLGNDYKVMASMGHVRDLPKSDLGIDIEHDFEPYYEPLAEKQHVVNDLRKAARGAKAIYLACDMDREGEAIAWHISQLLEGKEKITKRVTFNQITKAAIQRAFESPRDLDMNKVNAQQARRVLDRIVGYKLSQLLWQKVRRGLSAGRVQSVATRMVVERELEIRAFVPKEYWEFGGAFDSLRLRGDAAPAPRASEEGAEQPPYRLETRLQRLGEDKLDPEGFRIASEPEARALESQLAAARYSVLKVEEKDRSRAPREPFITSTLQQSASSELSFGTKRTMRIAQQLYEGVEVGGEGAVGLITYMRTDSVALAPEAIDEVRGFIAERFGRDYVPEAAIDHTQKRKRLKVAAQEAHEAIRPTSVLRTPESLAPFLNDEQLKLYTLVWRRFVACQMPPARFKQVSVEIAGQLGDGRQAVFRASGQRLLFDGFLVVSGREQGDRLLPPLEEGEAVELVPPLETAQKFTAPPARYNEASLVKKLEEEGIGRPSTYAAIISRIQEMGYVDQRNRALHATTKGEVVTRKLVQFFDDIMNYGYTRQMEENLDRVEGEADDDAGHHLPVLDWRQLLREFYGQFSTDLERATTEMKRVNDDAEESDQACPECGATMRKMWNTREFTQFLGCSRYPECKTTIPLDEEGRPVPEERAEQDCPRCGKALVLKSGRRGRFFACSGYPECKQTFELGEDGQPVAQPQVEAPCPECGTAMLVRKGRMGHFLGCPEYPKCRGTLPIVRKEDGTYAVGERGARNEMPQVDIKCERCGSPMAIKRSRRGPFLGCTAYPKCNATARLPADVELPKAPEPRPFGEDCEQCGKPLVIREGRRGPFVACSGYPTCKNTRNVAPA